MRSRRQNAPENDDFFFMNLNVDVRTKGKFLWRGPALTLCLRCLMEPLTTLQLMSISPFRVTPSLPPDVFRISGNPLKTSERPWSKSLSVVHKTLGSPACSFFKVTCSRLKTPSSWSLKLKAKRLCPKSESTSRGFKELPLERKQKATRLLGNRGAKSRADPLQKTTGWLIEKQTVEGGLLAALITKAAFSPALPFGCLGRRPISTPAWSSGRLQIVPCMFLSCPKPVNDAWWSVQESRPPCRLHPVGMF